MDERIAVVGLGYVGLPVALAFARHFAGTVGFDIDAAGSQSCGVATTGRARRGWRPGSTALRFTADPADLSDRTFFVVAVPTPVDADNRPDLSILLSASRTVGRVLRAGAVVVYESTVYPGVDRGDLRAGAGARIRALRAGTDFTLGYSPERINPGDQEHTLERITKVVSGQDEATLERVAAAYGASSTAGVHRAPIDQGRRGRQGHREHPARPEHRAHERARADLRPPRASAPRTCSRRPARSGTSCPSPRASWAATASASTPTTSPPRPSSSGYQPEVILAGRRINNRMGEHIAGDAGEAAHRRRPAA